jgi:hypothetical protein
METHGDHLDLNIVQIFFPDTAIRDKLGSALFEDMISRDMVEEAEKIIEASRTDFDHEAHEAFIKLRRAIGQLETGNMDSAALDVVIDAAFAIRSSAGFAGRELGLKLANALYVYAEGLRRGYVTHDSG